MNTVIEQAIEEGYSGFIVLEPREVFDGGIIGFDKDQNRLIYDYEKLVASLSKDNQDSGAYEEGQTAFEMAVEWIDYNTLRSLPYMGEFRPIIIVDDFEKGRIDYEKSFED